MRRLLAPSLALVLGALACGPGAGPDGPQEPTAPPATASEGTAAGGTAVGGRGSPAIDRTALPAEPGAQEAAAPVSGGEVFRAVNDGVGIDHPAFGSAPGGARTYMVEPPGGRPPDWVDPHCRQIYRLFLPKGPRPEHGWPVLVNLSFTAYSDSTDFRELRSDMRGEESRLAAFLDAGFAVINACVTPSSASFACQGTGGEPVTIEGGGLFQPPGFVPPGCDVAPYDSWRFAMSEKDAVMLVQHVRREAGRPGHLLEPLYRGPDGSTRIAVTGNSAAAQSLFWTTFGPERSEQAPFAGAGGQYAESARPDAAILMNGLVWFPLFNGGTGGDSMHYGTRGDERAQASTFGDVRRAILVEDSALHYDDSCSHPVPLYMAYSEPSKCTDYRGSDPWPCRPAWDLRFEGSGQDGSLVGFGHHPAWSGYVWKVRHPDTRLILRREEAFAQRDACDLDGDGVPDPVDAVLIPPPPDGSSINRAAQWDMIRWLQGVFADDGAAGGGGR